MTVTNLWPHRGAAAAERGTAERVVIRVGTGAEPLRRPDTLAVEEPLELRIGGRSLAVTMRTPGADLDLAAGFLVSEGLITGADDLVAMGYATDGGDDEGGPIGGGDRGGESGGDRANRCNVLDLTLGEGVAPPNAAAARAFFTTSSCGLCGKAGIDTVRTRSAYEVRGDPLQVDAAMLTALPGRLRAAQEVFERTGGLHAAALFDGSSGDLLVLREDVGRHNAVDKVIGWALRERRLPLRGTILLVSGRASFELAQKALMAGVPMLCAVSAPSSLAVDLAVESGMTLIGFLRDPTMVIYSGAARVGAGEPA